MYGTEPRAGDMILGMAHDRPETTKSTNHSSQSPWRLQYLTLTSDAIGEIGIFVGVLDMVTVCLRCYRWLMGTFREMDVLQ